MCFDADDVVRHVIDATICHLSLGELQRRHARITLGDIIQEFDVRAFDIGVEINRGLLDD